MSAFYWNRGSDGKRTLNSKSYFHPNCWIEQGMDYLKRNPYFPHNKTRLKTSCLTNEQKVLRYKLLRQKSAIDHRRKVLDVDYPDRLLIEARMDADIAELALRIAHVGGVPRRWLDQLL